MSASRDMSEARYAGAGRNVALLSACWALATSGNTILVSTAALTGFMLAPDKALATLPIAFQWAGTAAATIPASFLMRRIGRQKGFLVGIGFGMSGAALVILSLYLSAFGLLCLGIGLLGVYNGFNGYYRFAAADAVPENRHAWAISLTLAGGVVAAVLGPMLARATVDVIAPYKFMGAYLAIIGLAMVVSVLLAFVRIPPTPVADIEGPQRPLRAIARQPAFVVAVLGAAIGYGVMVLLMSVSPLAMVAQEHSFADATLAIQWHVVGMYAPAFFTGALIRRFGVLPIMLTGISLLVVCIAIAVSGTSVIHFWVSLALLGLGWNFCYVGGTTLLTETYTVAERAKVQALNDFLVFASAGFGSFFAGSLLHYFGWRVLNLSALPLVFLVAGATLWLMLRRRAVPTPAV